MKTMKSLVMALVGTYSLLLSWSEAWAWEVKIAGGGANAVAVDGVGNVVVAGGILNGNGASSFTVIKFNGVSGAELWRQVIIGTANSNGGAGAVTVDAAGNVIAAGITNVINYISNTITVVKLDGVSGAELWREDIHGSANGQDSADAIAVDAAGNVVVAGSTVNTGSSSDFTWSNLMAPVAQSFGARQLMALLMAPIGPMRSPWTLQATWWAQGLRIILAAGTSPWSNLMGRLAPNFGRKISTVLKMALITLMPSQSMELVTW